MNAETRDALFNLHGQPHLSECLGDGNGRLPVVGKDVEHALPTIERSPIGVHFLQAKQQTAWADETPYIQMDNRLFFVHPYAIPSQPYARPVTICPC